MTAYDFLAITGAILWGIIIGLMISAGIVWSLHQFGVMA